MRFLIVAAALFALCTSAFAGDFYVDAAAGSDVLGNGSPAAPWKTLGFGIGQVASTGNVIHMAPGVYDAASGEVFPIHPHGQVVIVGAGPGLTTVDAGAGSAAFEYNWQTVGFTVEPTTILENMSILGQHDGVVTAGFVGQQVGFTIEPTLRDLRIVVGGRGIAAGGNAGFPVIVRCDIGPANRGIDINLTDWGGSQVIEDCSIHGCQVGIDWDHLGNTLSPKELVLRRTELTMNGTGLAFEGSNNGGTEVRFEDSLIAGGSYGARLFNANDGALTILRSTITNNSIMGVEAPAGWTLAKVKSSILWGNGTDLDLSAGAPVDIAFTDIGNGGFAGTLGNLNVDPAFANVVAGDYHLTAGSPVLGAGTTLFSMRLDGELDPRPSASTYPNLDMGWDERSEVHLSVSGLGTAGSLLSLTTTTQGPSTVFALASFETGATYLGAMGWFALSNTNYVLLGSAPAPGTLSVPIPGTPSLAGLTAHCQVLAIHTGTLSAEFSNRADIVLH